MHEPLEPLLVKHQQARVILGYGNTKYWELVKAGEIEVVGKGAMSRATYASIKAFVEKLLAESRRRVAGN
jgi:hypothetical protein